MIPKVINYIWFGGGKHSNLQKKCIKSWKKFCPDFEIVRWDESNFDISACPLYVKKMYELKKWAFVSDYARLKILYDNGGLYFDTDTEVIKNVSHLLNNEAFMSFEHDSMLNSAVVGCCPKNKILQKLLEKYESLSCIDTTVTGRYITDVFLQYGLQLNGKEQQVDNWKIYPFNYFYPVKVINNNTYYTEDTCIVHWFEGTWFPKEYKKAKSHELNPFIKILRKTFLIKLYYKIKGRGNGGK